MSIEKAYYCYILANTKNGTLYTGVTSDLIRRAYEHRSKVLPGFTNQYQISKLVWFEVFQSAEEAILREKRIKKWNREWKLSLIESCNPRWEDLYDSLSG